MQNNENGATDMPTEVAGNATRESTGTDLRTNDGTAAGAPQERESEPPPPLAGVELPGEAYEIGN